MCNVWCVPNIASILRAKKLNFCFIRPENFLPVDLVIPIMPLGEQIFNELSSTVAFSLLVSHKALVKNPATIAVSLPSQLLKL